MFLCNSGGMLSLDLPEVWVELTLGQGHLVPGVKCRHPEIWAASAPARQRQRLGKVFFSDRTHLKASPR